MTTTLFTLEIAHAYFAGGLLEGWTLEPDPATRQALQRYGLLAGPAEAGFALHTFQQDVAGLLHFLAAQLDGRPLGFWLRCDEARFLAVTDLPLDWVGQVTLSTRNCVAEGDAWRIDPVLGPRTVRRDGVAGIVQIYPEDLAAMGRQNLRLAARFAARQVRWVYYLTNRGQQRLENPAIGKDGFYFRGPQSAVLPNGEKALRFDSGETAFPLQQRPSFVFDLIDPPADPGWANPDNTAHFVMKGLPAPAANEVAVKYSDGNAYVFCAMHVYL